MFKEFKEFAMKGNVLDLAVAMIIGGAFGKIVSSFVADILMPPLGYLIGGFDFKSLYLVLGSETYENLAAAQKAGAAVVTYGNFIQFLIDFLIISFSIFLVVKATNAMKKKKVEEPVKPTEPSEEILLLREIRDSLKKN